MSMTAMITNEVMPVSSFQATQELDESTLLRTAYYELIHIKAGHHFRCSDG